MSGVSSSGLEASSSMSLLEPLEPFTCKTKHSIWNCRKGVDTIHALGM